MPSYGIVVRPSDAQSCHSPWLTAAPSWALNTGFGLAGTTFSATDRSEFSVRAARPRATTYDC